MVIRLHLYSFVFSTPSKKKFVYLIILCQYIRFEFNSIHLVLFYSIVAFCYRFLTVFLLILLLLLFRCFFPFLSGGNVCVFASRLQHEMKRALSKKKTPINTGYTLPIIVFSFLFTLFLELFTHFVYVSRMCVYVCV